MRRFRWHDGAGPVTTEARQRIGLPPHTVKVVVAILVLGAISAQAAMLHAHDGFTPWVIALAWAGFAGTALCAASDTIEVGRCRRADVFAALFAVGGPGLGQVADHQPAPFASETDMPGVVTFGALMNPCRWSGVLSVLAGVTGAAIMAIVAVGISPLLAVYIGRQPVPLGDVEFIQIVRYALSIALVAITLFIAWWGLRSAWHGVSRASALRFAASERLLVRWSGRLRRARTPLLAWATAQARFLGGAALGVLALAVVSGLATRQVVMSLLVGGGVLVGGGMLLWLLGVGQPAGNDSPGAADEGGLASGGRSHANLAAVSWADVDAFCILARRRNLTGRGFTIYGVHAASGLLTWEIASTASAARMAANERLCRLIVTRTGLPLRDLSARASDAGGQGGRA